MIALSHGIISDSEQRYIAWSGEFLIRRVAHPKESATDPDQHTHPAEHISGGPPEADPPKEPEDYELVIDNDSGTYRPNADLIPTLREFLKRNFPGLHIMVKNCTDKDLDKIKDDQRKARKEEGDQRVYGQGSDSGSISSSDADDLEDRAQAAGEGNAPKTQVERVFSAIEHPKAAVGAAMPGHEEKVEREKAESREPEKSG